MIEYLLYGLLVVAALAFLFALFLGKPSKDEPIEETRVTELEDHEYFWHKKENV